MNESNPDSNVRAGHSLFHQMLHKLHCKLGNMKYTDIILILERGSDSYFGVIL